MSKNKNCILDPKGVEYINAIEAENRLFSYYSLVHKEVIFRMNEYNVDVRLLIIGEGKPLVIVPGNNGDGFVFIPLISLIKDRQIIIINRPGGGLSDGFNHKNVDMEKYAINLIESTLNFLNLKNIDLIGHSMGGHFCLWYANKNQENINSLTLLGVPGNIINTCPPFILRFASTPLLGSFLLKLILPKKINKALKSLEFMGQSKESLNKLPYSFYECYYYFSHLPYYSISTLSLMHSMNNLFGPKKKYLINKDLLTNIKIKTLMIYSNNDPFDKKGVMNQISELLNANTLLVQNGGHLPFVSDFDLCSKKINDFLGD
jgi:pimeloyl-ACP methyl ester carboxylesterase